MRIALIGCGALGAYIARAVETGVAGDHEMVAVLDGQPPRALSMGTGHWTGPRKVFSGNAVDGIERFPQNVNVAASVGLATRGPETLGLTLLADPSLDSNIHRLELKGDFGEATVEIRAKPMPHNPKSSALAALSVLALLARVSSPQMILRLAPYAVFALMAYTVAEYGASILTAMAKLLVTIWMGTILFVVAYTVIVNLLVVKQSPVKFFRALGEASMMAIATCSSMAAMPVNVENTHSKLGVPREIATMVIGAGTAIINGGSGFYKAIGVVFVASLYGVELTALQLLVVAAVTAFVVSAGVPAAGTLAIAVALTTFSIPLEGIALLMAIDRLRDMVSTWGNVVIHSLGACTVHSVIRGGAEPTPSRNV